MYIKANMSKTFRRILKSIFPRYTGRKFYLSFSRPSTYQTYWDGGSCSFYAIYNPVTGAVQHLPMNHPFYEKHVGDNIPINWDAGDILLRNSCFCGKYTGITIYLSDQQARTLNLYPSIQSLLQDMHTNIAKSAKNVRV